MEKKRNTNSTVFMWVLVAILVSQNLAIPVMCNEFEDQKNYYSPDPHHHSTPKTPSSHHNTPSHVPSPSHGTGNCGTPPSPRRHQSPPTPTGGGGYSYPPPSSSTPPIITPPSYSTPPSTPSIIPGTPVDPNTPPTPFIPDPNSPPSFPIPGTCNWWRTHPTVIWGLLGWWGTVGSAFGVASTPASGTSMSLLDALANTRTDGIGALYREGTASFLNSLADRKFPFTTQQVKDSFAASLVSNRAAKSQAELFKQANEGRFKPKA